MNYEKSVFLIMRNKPSPISPIWVDMRRFVEGIYKLALTLKDDKSDNKRTVKDRQNANASQNKNSCNATHKQPQIAAHFILSQRTNTLQLMTERILSELQKEYRNFFLEKMKLYGVKSPAELTKEKKSEFFTEIKNDWTKYKLTKQQNIERTDVNVIVEEPEEIYDTEYSTQNKPAKNRQL
jgi:hypothetical protein